jgi:hypothetical protein
MTAVSRFAVAGQLCVEIDVDGAGNVAGLVQRAPNRAAEAPAHIEHTHRGASGCGGALQRGEFVGGHERMRHPVSPIGDGHGSARPKRGQSASADRCD